MELIQSTLSHGGIDCDLVRVETRADFQAALEAESLDVILSDYSLPSFDGISALVLAQHLRPDLPFIFVSGTLGEELAIETLKSGATDYVLKQRLGRLVPAIERSLREVEESRELQRAQQALQEANVLLDTLFNNAPLGIGIWDEQLRFVRLNNALAEMNGLPIAAHLGKTIAELLPGVSADVTLALRQVVSMQNPIIAQEASGETPAAPGQHRYWSVNYYPIRLSSQVTWVGAICEEITERKQAEAEREQLLEREQAARQEAVAANRIKDDFLAILSHELR
jgi:PAS domain S-box-containing protein